MAPVKVGQVPPGRGPMFHKLSPKLVQVTLWPAPQAEPWPKVLKFRFGKAFPATHPTSRLCLELLQEVLAAAPVSNLLDVGCGAGVLSLAAAALGVPRVVALDISGHAARETRENARENDLAGPLLVARGSAECVKAAFDLVMANLFWEVQLDKATELSRLAAPAGALILSGFRDYRENLLKERYQSLGWSLSHRVSKDFRHPDLPPDLSFTWVAWVLKRNETSAK